MTAECQHQADPSELEIILDTRHLPVSYVSSLLRVVQAAIREVGRNNDDTRQTFSQQPWPVLVMSTFSTEEDWMLRFVFTDPMDSAPLTRLSAQTFGEFMERLSQFLKTLPQLGLWGKSVAGSPHARYDSEVTRRMDELRQELRHFPKSRLTFGNRTIAIEGDQMEISQWSATASL